MLPILDQLFNKTLSKKQLFKHVRRKHCLTIFVVRSYAQSKCIYYYTIWNANWLFWRYRLIQFLIKFKMSGLLNEGVGNWLKIFFFNIFFVVNQNKIRLNLQTGVLCILCTSSCKELVTQTNQQFIDQLSYKEKRNQK